jgi:hypothetical protein
VRGGESVSLNGEGNKERAVGLDCYEVDSAGIRTGTVIPTEIKEEANPVCRSLSVGGELKLITPANSSPTTSCVYDRGRRRVTRMIVERISI